MADQIIYKHTSRLHKQATSLVANLWHAPSTFVGTATVGSSEACILASFALRQRWREWHAMYKPDEALPEPQIVISSLYQSCWEKVFRFADMTPRVIHPYSHDCAITAQQVAETVCEATAMVVCILGDHYTGQYDPVHAICLKIDELNRQHGWQIGVHVDAASGGFIAPFQSMLEPWDSRNQCVMSISGSGHKYGQAMCGIGWLVFKTYETLARHVSTRTTYLGGEDLSLTLNFS